MVPVGRLVVDVLKPHQPSTIEFTQRVAGADSVAAVNATLIELDQKVKNLKLTIEGDAIDYGEVEAAIEDAGGLRYDVGNGRERAETDATVEYSSYGGLSTADALGDAELMAKVREEGTKVLDNLSVPPTLREVFERSWPFAQALGLPTARVVEDVERVQDAGGAATMAMLGETVVAVDCEGVLDHRTRVSTAGARLL
ncbi:DUF211 domain-containing protein [Haloparvum sedimenti]|uniref:DUF211 domain-containing protein n=1 Tax=Haloparvum sedimenti TaxID=1678448 RepID=UPI00071E9A79|nr:DUF211 domain-containing protein [Haloparvum sedimenti]